MFRKMIAKLVGLLFSDVDTLLPKRVAKCFSFDGEVFSAQGEESDVFKYIGEDHFLNDDPYDFRDRFDPGRFISDPFYSHMLGNIYHHDENNF